jgi:hypothetical protein
LNTLFASAFHSFFLLRGVCPIRRDCPQDGGSERKFLDPSRFGLEVPFSPRVAALHNGFRCDEADRDYDEPNRQLMVYPLVSESR